MVFVRPRDCWGDGLRILVHPSCIAMLKEIHHANHLVQPGRQFNQHQSTRSTREAVFNQYQSVHSSISINICIYIYTYTYHRAYMYIYIYISISVNGCQWQSQSQNFWDAGRTSHPMAVPMSNSSPAGLKDSRCHACWEMEGSPDPIDADGC